MLRLFKDLAVISRIEMSPLTISVPIFGALTVTHNLTWQEYLVLGVIGLCAHIFGFTLNDIFDSQLDRTTQERKSHPFATSRLSRKAGLLFSLIQVPLALGIYKFFMNGTLLAVGVLFCSIILSLIYNIFSKRSSLPRLLVEMALAASIGLLCLCGVLIKTSVLSADSIIFAVTLTIILLLVNSVPSHLKDIKTDQDFGVRSFVLSTGTKVIGDDEVKVTKVLWFYSVVLQVLVVIGIINLMIPVSPVWFYTLLAILFVIYASLHLRMLLSATSFKQIRNSMPLLSGAYNYFALSTFIASAFSGIWALMYWLIILWLATIPFSLAWQVWRNPYRMISK